MIRAAKLTNVDLTNYHILLYFMKRDKRIKYPLWEGLFDFERLTVSHDIVDRFR